MQTAPRKPLPIRVSWHYSQGKFQLGSQTNTHVQHPHNAHKGPRYHRHDQLARKDQQSSMDINANTLNKAYEELVEEDDSPFTSPDPDPHNDIQFKGLHNPQAPQHEILHERIRHRALAYLIGSGRTQREAAAEMGYTEPWVSQICRQDWFQQLILEEITRTGRSIVDELIKNAAPGSVLKLLELRDSAQSESVQFNASKELLNRYLGNTTMVVRHEESEASKDPVEEVERLEREAERLRNTR